MGKQLSRREFVGLGAAAVASVVAGGVGAAFDDLVAVGDLDALAGQVGASPAPAEDPESDRAKRWESFVGFYEQLDPEEQDIVNQVTSTMIAYRERSEQLTQELIEACRRLDQEKLDSLYEIALMMKARNPCAGV